jgi:HAD superfamily hydrolase (TIGR01493 family)
MLDPTTIRAVAFDCVNTVFDVSQLSLSYYIEQVRRPKWAPLVLPDGWENCPAHADSAEGINRITDCEYIRTATCSNWPIYALSLLSYRAGVRWSAYVPMESEEVYKPEPMAYLSVAVAMGVCPSQVLMVTANETAPDLEAAKKLGMQSILIDREREHADGPKTIIELAEMLGCPK